jgi:hypothetical protein
MSKSDSTYQNTKVQLPQGADKLSIDSDGYLDFFGTTVTGDTLKKLLSSNQAQTIVRASNTVLSSPNLPQNGFVFLRLSETGSNLSAWLPACSAGDELVIAIQNFLVESVLSVKISTSACSIVGLQFSDVSNIGLHTSNGSAGILKLKCFTDDEWTVVGGDQSKFAERSIS